MISFPSSLPHLHPLLFDSLLSQSKEFKLFFTKQDRFLSQLSYFPWGSRRKKWGIYTFFLYRKRVN